MPDDMITPGSPTPPPPGPDGDFTPQKAEPAPPTQPAPPRLTLLGWAVTQVVNIAIFLLLWGILIVALWASPLSLEWANAVGFGFLMAFFGTFFFRSLIVQAVGKNVASKVPGLAPPPPPPPASPIESFREVIETVVFVVVLVLLLKSFVAEAFVIPTGSMAETLWGYQKLVTCPKCEHRFPVNCSNEVEQGRGGPVYIDGCTCPNCRQRITMFRPHDTPPAPRDEEAVIPDPGYWVPDWLVGTLPILNVLNGPRSGDRVLVAKYPYDLPGGGPNRLDVVVFKFPGDDADGDFPVSGPFKSHVPMNYIKRLIGLPGETIAIKRGKVYALPADRSPNYPEDDKEREDASKAVVMWRRKPKDHLHPDDERAQKKFNAGEFAIIRKPPQAVTAMMRLVYDNDRPAKDLTTPEYQRWVPIPQGGSLWSEGTDRGFVYSGADLNWLRYRHILRDDPGKPQLITDFMGYNQARPRGGEPGTNWASDLIVECQVQADRAEGKLVLELARGPSLFQAELDAATGTCTLYRLRDGQKSVELKQAATKFKGAGTYNLRFANVDDRVVLWVNGELPFGDGVPYEAAPALVPTVHNDLDRPVSVGAQGGKFTVRHLKVYRDTYYTTGSRNNPGAADVPELDPKVPAGWKHVAETPLATYYVQPGHYLCLGDNSPESADSRSWGLVPDRLMLGRAVLVYFPFTRVGQIR